MNNTYQLKRTGKSAINSNGILALLLLISIVQISLCFGASFSLVPTSHASVGGPATAYITNTPFFQHSEGKTSSMQSVLGR